MYKISFLMLVGVLVFLTPFFGLPSGLQAGLLCIFGVIIVVTAFSIRKMLCAERAISFKERMADVPLDSLTLSDRV